MRPVACKYQWGHRWWPIESVMGVLTEHTFCRRLSRSSSIDSRYCNQIINLGRQIASLNHSSASAGTVFTIPTTFGIAHARCYTRAEQATQLVTWVGSSLLESLTVPSTHYVPKIVFTFSLICSACTNSIAIYLIIMRDFIFLYISPHQQSAISSGWLWLLVMARLFHAPTRMTSSGCLMLHRTVHALWNLYGNPYRNLVGNEEETVTWWGNS